MNADSPFGYDPRYGLPDDYRLRVLEYAEAFGITRALEHYAVSQASLYRWRAALQKQQQE